MKIFKLVFKNTLRHKLRTFLTIIGIAIAVIAFGLLRTVVTAWYAGVDASAANRLITRQAISFIFPLPYYYKDRISQVPGIEIVTYANWFQGVYKDKNQFFTRMAVDAETFFDVYPEFKLPKEALDAFKKERRGCIVGRDIAKQYGFKVGDIIPIEGDIYPGNWEFIVKGIYTPRDKTTDGTQMLIHWDYLNEKMEQDWPGRANEVGWYISKIKDPAMAGGISKQIDNLFANSSAETKTEDERSFQQSFMASVSAIITAMNFISFVIIGIIMLVLGNTMIMSARERTREYAVMKTLGFSAKHLTSLIMGESFIISCIGSGIGIALLFPIVSGFEMLIPKGYFPIFRIEPITVVFAAMAAIIIGIIASLFPLQKALRTTIVEGFRHVG